MYIKPLEITLLHVVEPTHSSCLIREGCFFSPFFFSFQTQRASADVIAGMKLEALYLTKKDDLFVLTGEKVS